CPHKQSFRSIIPAPLVSWSFSVFCRIPQPQRASSSDSEGSSVEYDVYKLGCFPTRKDLHGLCKKFSHYSWAAKLCTADTVARMHMEAMLDNFFRSSETVCDELMYAVLVSPDCNVPHCMYQFMRHANGGSVVEDSEEQRLAKVKAVRAIGAVVRHLSDLQTLTTAFPFYLTTLTNILVSQSQPLKAGTGSQFKKYVAPGEVIDILGVLLQRLDLVQQMTDKVCPL
ncbi:uncharacterized protein LOC121918183, partial [Sceloporus undulatus]|uniref:uncharacterized protein LOC121918183 n=1 Tax=Sceloporus undulatus TaxID=8520 RepID=UPI001C4B3D83